MHITTEAIAWVKHIAAHLTEARLRELVREALENARERQAASVDVDDLELAYSAIMD